MPLTLVRRAGPDTLGKLEGAARRRFREAEKLLNNSERLGAIYLFGYSIEITLKSAYYRTIGLVPTHTIDPLLHRKPAEAAIAAMPLLPRHPITGGPHAGHHLVGWARLLEQTRAANGDPMVNAIATKMHDHARAVFDCWVEFLRYRDNRPYDVEVKTVRAAAKWFRANAARLRS
jgi:hypothetical protein